MSIHDISTPDERALMQALGKSLDEIRALAAEPDGERVLHPLHRADHLLAVELTDSERAVMRATGRSAAEILVLRGDDDGPEAA